MHALSDGRGFIQVTLADSTGNILIDIGDGHPHLVIVIYAVFVGGWLTVCAEAAGIQDDTGQRVQFR